jgi:hypothetical protein
MDSKTGSLPIFHRRAVGTPPPHRLQPSRTANRRSNSRCARKDWNNSKPAEFNLPRVHFEPSGHRALTGKRPTIERQEIVLESSGRAVLAFLADGLEQARELCSQHWFMDELASYRSCGHPIWDGTADLRIRHANPSEAAEVQIALANEQCRKEYDGYVFVFFVPVDAGLQ